MKNKLYLILSFVFFTVLALDILAIWIIEKNPTHLVAQTFAILSFSLTLILCVPMLLLSDFRKAS